MCQQTFACSVDRESSYLACGSIISIWLQQMTNEVLGIVTNILPVSLVEDDSGIAALVDEILEVLAAERGVAT